MDLLASQVREQHQHKVYYHNIHCILNTKDVDFSLIATSAAQKTTTLPCFFKKNQTSLCKVSHSSAGGDRMVICLVKHLEGRASLFPPMLAHSPSPNSCMQILKMWTKIKYHWK